jgi:antitoxin component of MazEF toxin-antitoxin module
MEATLVKWGNSQGVRIPGQVCAELGVHPGAVAEMAVDPATSSLTLTFQKPRRRYARTRKMTMEEFAAGWEGGKVGAEWGGPDVGTEVVR